MIKMTHVEQTYSDVPVLHDVSFEANAGELIALVGPSGSGKSTLLQLLGLLQTPTAGDIQFGEQHVNQQSDEQRRKMRLEEIGFIFQESHLVPFLTAAEQLELVAEEAGRTIDAVAMLAAFGLKDRADHLPHALSGGERQRVAIIRALVNQPRLVLADEPTASLDYMNGRQVMEVLQKQAHDEQKMVIVITHDERMLEYCDRVLRIEDGYLSEVE
ncbi:ABC transporter ATP-binding protein [Exiguobacterium oxidotolerans]|uniref:Putative hemin import ATP-binding protein HrtA n=1 Tax=Exiguobacterium oxidotolerans TaxID=223958 RepID=A0A653I9M5_9BACL|nr:ABC transporter ATP-binding protein [Exiguobacterium oxidotolerans]VWX35541.1 putative hemin import ATP-binding protein HrtA [Exiguobacterium oxidotolerans]